MHISFNPSPMRVCSNRNTITSCQNAFWTHGPRDTVAQLNRLFKSSNYTHTLSNITTASLPSPPVSPLSPSKLRQSAMDGWSKLSASLNNLNISQASTKFSKGFSSSVQATRERLGQVSPDDITELPQGERRSPLDNIAL